MALLIFNLGTRWGWVFKAKPWLLYPSGGPRSPLQERLGELQGQSGWVCTRENLSTPLGFIPQTVQHVASPYTKYIILVVTSVSTVHTYER